MRWQLRRDQRLPLPPTPPVDDRRVLGVGTVAWLALLLAALLAHGWLAQTGRSWWVWTCVVGVALGFVALARENRRRSRRPPRRPVREGLSGQRREGPG